MKTLRTSAGTLVFSCGQPWLMATVVPGPGALELALGAVGAGAQLIGIGDGPSRPEVISRLRDELDVPLAVLTGSASSASAGLAAGAAIVDASQGIESPELPELCARHGAALVVPLETPAAATGPLPGGALMHGAGAGAASPGERPLLLHLESPELPEELAAIARGLELGASVLGVSDVAAAADFLAVRDVLDGRREIDRDARLPAELRREPAAAAAVEHPPR